MSDFQIRQATRQGVKPLIVPYSESGCGKTMSSLLLARGFVGPTGKMVMVDSESGRGELYADVIPGGYEVLRLDQPFSPARYIQAVQAAVAAGAQIVIVDSGSHEWEGIGGVLDMAGENEARSGKPGLHCWKTPKLEHAKFVLSLLQAPVPVVVCLRAKHKSRQGKDERGKTVIIKDEHTSPIQAEDFIFEATAHFEILKDHSVHVTKCSHPTLLDCFPKQGPITVRHGELLAQWCANPGSKPTTSKPEDLLTPLRKELRKMLAPSFCKGGKWTDAEWKAAQQFLYDEMLLDPSTNIASLDQPGLEALIHKVNQKVNEYRA